MSHRVTPCGPCVALPIRDSPSRAMAPCSSGTGAAGVSSGGGPVGVGPGSTPGTAGKPPAAGWRPPVPPPHSLLLDFGGVGGTLLQLSDLWDQWNLGVAMLLEDIRVVMGELL